MNEKHSPERIWATKPTSSCVVSFTTPSLDYSTEYVRADLLAKKEEEFLSKSRELMRLQTELAQTRRKALEEAIDVCSDKNSWFAIRALIEAQTPLDTTPSHNNASRHNP